MARYRIAVIPGDGIGRETVPEGIRVLAAAGSRLGIDFDWDTLAALADSPVLTRDMGGNATTRVLGGKIARSVLVA